MNTCTSRETRINPIKAHFQSSSPHFFLKLGSASAGFSGYLWNFSLKPRVAKSLLFSVAVSSDQDPGPQSCRVVAPSTVGSVSTGPLFGAQNCFLHTLPLVTPPADRLATMCSVVKLQDRCKDGCDSFESVSS